MKIYKPVIGLEIHVELKTESKMFCQCLAHYFGKKPNTNTCPVCLGLPGALPVPNKKAIDWTILIGKALNCQINKISRFDRKHYFYPDLPKGYQISQYQEPFAINGLVHPSSIQRQNKKFRITRVHLEEDTGKLLHKGNDTLIDFNRSGVPLVEIVTEPDFDNSDEVKTFLEELQVIVRYLGVSDADMEKGTMRLEPNISLRPDTGKFELPKYKVEVKNINSFRFVRQAIEYEIKRQTEILESGKVPAQETRGFRESDQSTYSQRSKEEAHDYRYFPEPDIPPLRFTEDYLAKLERSLPEMPGKKLDRYVNQLGLKAGDAFILTRNQELSVYFEEVLRKIADIKVCQAIANFIINKKISSSLPVDEFVTSAIQLLKPVETDTGLLNQTISKVINANPKVTADYKSGKENAIMFLVGQVMREMKGKAEAKTVIAKLKEALRP